MKQVLFFVGFLIGLWFVMAMISIAQAIDCSGYPEKRVLMESQSWWSDTKTPFPGAHVHLETCFPLHQKVRGVVHFDVTLRLHNMQNNGFITLLRNQVYGNGSDTTKKSLALKCDVADCAWVIPFDVDTMRQTYDGRWEFRMTANIPKTVAGDRMYQTTRWHAFLDNGKPVKNGAGSSSRSPGAGGWYTGVEYENVHCGHNDSGHKLVSAPASGLVDVTCSFNGKTAFASIDPAFHATPLNYGKVLLDSTGGTKSIAVDTTKLVNGMHKLFLRTGKIGTKPVGNGFGVLVLWFEVNN